MNKNKTLAALSAVSIFAALGYWFYLYLSDPENAPTVGDFYGYLQSVFVRGYLIVKGKAQFGSSADALSIAAGFIAQHEGFSPRRYADPPGQTETYSIGYGHQIQSGEPYDDTTHMAQSDALDLLQADLQTYAQCVDNAVTVGIGPQQSAALYSLCYNIGCGNFQRSTLVRLLNTGDYDGALAQFAVWNKAGGVVNSALVSRRQDETDLFASDSGANDSTEEQSA